MIVAVTEDFDACMAIRQRVFVEDLDMGRVRARQADTV